MPVLEEHAVPLDLADDVDGAATIEWRRRATAEEAGNEVRFGRDVDPRVGAEHVAQHRRTGTGRSDHEDRCDRRRVHERASHESGHGRR